MTEILGYMQLGNDCCGYPFGELRDASKLDEAIEDMKDQWWMAPFVVFYRKDGVFLCEQIHSEPDNGKDYQRHIDYVRSRIKELSV